MRFLINYRTKKADQDTIWLLSIFEDKFLIEKMVRHEDTRRKKTRLCVHECWTSAFHFVVKTRAKPVNNKRMNKTWSKGKIKIYPVSMIQMHLSPLFSITSQKNKFCSISVAHLLQCFTVREPIWSFLLLISIKAQREISIVSEARLRP